MCRTKFCAAVLLLCLSELCWAGNFPVPTTTLAAQKANNTSAAGNFPGQTNGNLIASNVSKVNLHSLLYPGATTKIYAHLVLWFGGSNHMNVGYSSTDSNQVHKQIVDMISRGIDGVILDWYGPNNGIDQAAKLVMAEAESHPGFSFAIMVDQGAIKWNSCSGCSPQQALINQLQYVEQTYFPSPAYLRQGGQPVVTNFNIDLAYSINWVAVNSALATQPVFLFQNNDGFSHTESEGSYSWVMPTTTDDGMSYLTSFYDTGMTFPGKQAVGAAYKGFNDSLAAWGSGRVISQRCGQTWLNTFSKINQLYNSGRQLPALQLVTWNDYEEGTEIESGIANCLAVSAAVSGSSLQWTIQGKSNTLDHYVTYISSDGQNLMRLAQMNVGTSSLNLCSYSIPNGTYTLYVQAVGKPTIRNQMSGPVTFRSQCQSSTTAGGSTGTPTLSFNSDPASLTIPSGGSGSVTITAIPSAGSFDSSIALACGELPSDLACSFAPAAITPGGGPVSSSLTLASAKVAAVDYRHRNAFFASWIVSFGLFGITLIGKVQRRRLAAVLGTLALAALVICGTSCGGGKTSAASSTVASSAARYTVTVNGSSSALQVSTAITVIVE